jgi:hypothetical protein
VLDRLPRGLALVGGSGVKCRVSPMELEESSFNFKPVADQRPRVPEPLPVRLIAVADMRVDSPAGLERGLDDFYVALLGMERVAATDAIVYRTENFDLYVDVLEPPVTREDYRPVRVEVKSLAEMQLKFIEAELEHTRRKGLTPGDEALVLQDPAGNWVEVTESRILG